MKLKFFLSLAGLLAWSGARVYAQDQAPAKPAQPDAPLTDLSPQQQSALSEGADLARTARLWRKRIDWQESDSSTPEIAAHIQKTLGASAPSIEVRGQDTNHSTFALQQAPLGPLLCTIAELAGYRLWVFPKRLLLCKEETLTGEERALMKRGVGGDWKKSSAAEGGWDTDGAWEQTIVHIVVDDIKQHLQAKGQTILKPALVPPAPDKLARPTFNQDYIPSYQLPLGEMNSSVQYLLQQLTNGDFRGLYRLSPEDTPPVLAPDIVVSVNDTNPEEIIVFLRTPQTVKGKQSTVLYRWRTYKPKTF